MKDINNINEAFEMIMQHFYSNEIQAVGCYLMQKDNMETTIVQAADGDEFLIIGGMAAMISGMIDKQKTLSDKYSFTARFFSSLVTAQGLDKGILIERIKQHGSY